MPRTPLSLTNIQPLHMSFEDRCGEPIAADGIRVEMLQALFKDQGINVLGIRTRSQLNQAISYCCSELEGATAFADRLGQFALDKLADKNDLNSRLQREAISDWLARKPSYKGKMLRADRLSNSGLKAV